MELKDFYTVRELAALLNVLPQNVRRLINEGKLKADKLSGAFIIPKDEAERLIEEKGGKV